MVAKQYKTQNEVIKDITLVFENSMAFNASPTDEYHSEAKRMLTIFKKKIDDLNLEQATQLAKFRSHKHRHSVCFFDVFDVSS